MTEASGSNPFRPGVGTRPLHLAGRDAEMRRFGSVLRGAPENPANVRLTGLRGVGKTVLLHEFERIAEKDGWAVAFVELQPRHNRDATLAESLVTLCSRTKERLSKVERLRAAAGKARALVGNLGVTYRDVTVSIGAGETRERDLSLALFEVTEMAVSRTHRGFAILLDEAQVLRDDRAPQGEHPLSMLIAAVSNLQKQELPVAIVVCGLPTLTGNLLKARTYTERMFRGEKIGSLDSVAAREAFIRPLTEASGMTAERVLVEDVLAAVEGYPYFIQLWGAELWDAAVVQETRRLTRELLVTIEPEIYRRLDLDFYEPRVQTLTPAEQDVLMTAAHCPYPPLKVSDIHAQIDKTPGNVNVLLGRLADEGVIYRLRKGQYEYTAPKFYDYLQRRLERGS